MLCFIVPEIVITNFVLEYNVFNTSLNKHLIDYLIFRVVTLPDII